MPTYEYICNACGHEFELFQSMRDPVKRKCPKCAKPKLERLIGTGAAVIFKGSGFYQTDYRSEGYKKAAEAETKGAEPKSQGDAKQADKKTGSDAKASPEKPSEKTPARESPAATEPPVSPSKPARRRSRK